MKETGCAGSAGFSLSSVSAGFSRDNQELKAALRLAEVAEIRVSGDAFILQFQNWNEDGS